MQINNKYMKQLLFKNIKTFLSALLIALFFLASFLFSYFYDGNYPKIVSAQIGMEGDSLPNYSAGPAPGSCVLSQGCASYVGDENLTNWSRNLFVGSVGVSQTGLPLPLEFTDESMNPANGAGIFQSGILVNYLALGGLYLSADTSAQFMGGFYNGRYVGRVSIGTDNPNYMLNVNGNTNVIGNITATGTITGSELAADKFNTGDIIMEKNGKKLWRLFEEEDAIYAENLTTGKTYKFNLEEVK